MNGHLMIQRSKKQKALDSARPESWRFDFHNKSLPIGKQSIEWLTNESLFSSSSFFSI